MAKLYVIGGIPVEFPYKAYGPQLAYMGKVVATLEQSRLKKEGRCNALLESPTGSGKSLALLCATLAWQQHYKSLLKSNHPPVNAPDPSDVLAAGGGFIIDDPAIGSVTDTCNGCDSIHPRPGMETPQAEIVPEAPKVPRIFYATRTHAQIKQVIREFRKTKYRVPMAILASKKHYCTNKSVRKNKNVDEDCLVLLRGPEEGVQGAPGCPKFRNAPKVKAHHTLQPGAANDIHDIEDLVKIGYSVKGCAYFAARSMAMEAEIIFCPYSYIIDPIIREAVEADIRGSIIIFDEAHNIEDVAREAGSIDLETSVLLDMELELQQLCTSEPTADFYQPLLDMVQELVAWIEGQARNLARLEFEHHSSWWTGDKAVQELRSAGIPLESFEVLSSCCKKAMAAASDEKSRHLSGFLVKSLERLFKVLQFVLRDKAQRAVDYQLVIQKFVRNSKGFQGKQWTVMFSLWCLNPAVVFDEVSSRTRSVIVTSGTLAPVDSFASELGVLFDLRIEAPHVVDMGKQVWAAAISVGPREVVLNASYKNTTCPLFQDAVGAALLEIFKVTPDGVLVFFPSYKLLTKLCDRWASTGLWRRLAGHKHLFIEPRNNDEIFESVLQGYYAAIKGILPTPVPKPRMIRGNVQAMIPLGDPLATGAALLAVCRGKVSEGIDFSDKNARAVVVVGIPFPNVKDIQVSLKKQYNSLYQVTKQLLSGDQWYCQQAFRALNQAIGRCIRHRYDYGAIILLDERFKASRNLEHMSKWLKKGIRQSNNFEASMGQLQDFFNRLKGFDAPATPESPLTDKLPESPLADKLPETPLPHKLPEFSVKGIDRFRSPITPNPMTPFKEENGLQRSINRVELSTLSETHVYRKDVPALHSPILRSELLTQFDATEHGPTPMFCQEDPGETVATDRQPTTELCFSRPPVLPSARSKTSRINGQSFQFRETLGDERKQQGELDDLYDKDEDFTISIADDDTSLFSMEVEDCNDEEPFSASFLSKNRPDTTISEADFDQLAENFEACGSLGKTREKDVSNLVDSNCLEGTCGKDVPSEVSNALSSDIQSNPQNQYKTMYCKKCEVMLGVVNNLDKTTLEKSFLKSLLESNRLDSERDFGCATVYFTDISLINPGCIEQRQPHIPQLRSQFGNYDGSPSGIWVEEDGCVFKPLVCSSCPNFYIGAHIKAVDCINLTLNGKVAIFGQSINFRREKVSWWEDNDDQNTHENVSCQQPAPSMYCSSPPTRTQMTLENVSCQPWVLTRFSGSPPKRTQTPLENVSCQLSDLVRSSRSPPKRTQTTQLAKRKLKLQRRVS